MEKKKILNQPPAVGKTSSMNQQMIVAAMTGDEGFHCLATRRRQPSTSSPADSGCHT
jgi:hypothetical protein